MHKHSPFYQETIHLIGKEEREKYYDFLLRAFRKEFLGSSNRQIIENLTRRSMFSAAETSFLKKIVHNLFAGKGNYQSQVSLKNRIYHPIDLINYIVAEGYAPTSSFIHWVYKKLQVKWSAIHWFMFLQRDIAPIDAAIIKKELIAHPKKIPALLELYYKLGVGLERAHVHPGKGIKKSIIEEFKGEIKYKGFNPIDYLLDYYGELDMELMTLTKSLYHLLLQKRSKFPKKSLALIVGNGPIPDDAQVLAMIPEIDTIIPADIDPRNNKIMKMHTGRRNPLATQKAKHGEEHADYVYFLCEQAAGAKIGLFPVREITAVKTRDPIFIDIQKSHPLHKQQNSPAVRNIRPDLVEVLPQVVVCAGSLQMGHKEVPLFFGVLTQGLVDHLGEYKGQDLSSLGVKPLYQYQGVPLQYLEPKLQKGQLGLKMQW